VFFKPSEQRFKTCGIARVADSVVARGVDKPQGLALHHSVAHLNALSVWIECLSSLAETSDETNESSFTGSGGTYNHNESDRSGRLIGIECTRIGPILNGIDSWRYIADTIRKESGLWHGKLRREISFYKAE